MVGTLLGNGADHSTGSGGTRERIGVTLHAAASVLGGGAFGASLGLIGGLLFGASPSRAALAAGGVAAVYSLRESGLVKVPAPQSRRQVPNAWRWRYRPEVASALYGGALGVGVATPIAITSFYVLPIYALFSGSVFISALVLGAYGLGRAVPLVPLRADLSRSGETLEQLLPALLEHKPVVSYLNALILALIGPYLIVAALHGWFAS
jgi:hypothetical protein